MPGPLPKPPGLRQRANRISTRAVLPVDANVSRRVPPLPQREDGWHTEVVRWWKSVWTSPMAGEYLDVDVYGLYLIAELHQQRWTCESSSELVKVSAEIRLQEARFGTSPVDRRRLQWEIPRGEDAAERTQRRRAPHTADPRDMLKVER